MLESLFMFQEEKQSTRSILSEGRNTFGKYASVGDTIEMSSLQNPWNRTGNVVKGCLESSINLAVRNIGNITSSNIQFFQYD